MLVLNTNCLKLFDVTQASFSSILFFQQVLGQLIHNLTCYFFHLLPGSGYLFFSIFSIFKFLSFFRAPSPIHHFVPLCTFLCVCSWLCHLSLISSFWLGHLSQIFTHLTRAVSAMCTSAASSNCLSQLVAPTAHKGVWLPEAGDVRTLVCQREAVHWRVRVLIIVQERLSNFLARNQLGLSGVKISLLVTTLTTFRKDYLYLSSSSLN